MSHGGVPLMESNLFDLTGKVALVTGTSRGLGQFFARALARAGADLIITSRQPATLGPFQSEIEALGYAGLAPYGASRGGVKQLTMSVADDWGVHGITVNCLAPGWFKTAQTAVLYEDKEWVDYLCDRIPLRRPGQPGDLDGAIVFLASDASEYVTAQTLLIDTRAMPKKK